MQPLLIYCYDAWCGWCFGFGPVMKQIVTKYADKFQFEVLSGGMILPEQPVSIQVMADYIKEAYPTVEERTGIRFGNDFLWHIQQADQSDWFPSSELPAIALCVFKSFLPNNQVQIASDIQYALFGEGRDLTDKEAYRHLLPQYGIDENLFYQRLSEPTFKEQAYEEFEMCKQLRVTGFPQLLCRISETKYQLVASGYTDEQTIHNRLQQILLSIQA
jgi:putative protein-disulfide isomerase